MAGGDDDTSGRALQPEVSSGRSGRRLSSTGDDVCGNPPACGPSAQLPAIAEEDGSGASAAQSHRRAARARQQIHGQQQQQQQQIQEQQNPSQQQSQVQEQRAYQTGRPAMQVGRRTDADSSSSSDGEGEWDFDSPDMVASLAATIRSALGGAMARPRAAAVQPAAARAPPDADAEQLKHLRWRPDTGLELPHAAAAVVACTAAAAGGRRNRQLAAAGPRVAGGVASADPTAPGGSHTTSGSSPLLAAPPQGAVKPRGLAKAVRAPTLDPAAVRKAERAAAPDTAGKGWFHLPATKITDDVKRDLRLLRLRGAYDPKRFYRSFDETKFPKHFAVRRARARSS
jgi:Fcf2 pre-rRNA processing